MQADIKQKINNVLEATSLDSLKHYFPYIKGSKQFNPEKDTVYYSGPFWDTEEPAAIIDSVLHGKWLSSGEKVRKFEIEFSKTFKFQDSVMVNSGSSANLVMVAAIKDVMGWKDGDEVIISPVGFPTTIAPVVQNGLKPVFIDIEFKTLNFDLNLIETKISSKTKAVFLSPVLGNPPDMDKLLEICDNHGIQIILDNCDSLGSKWNGKYLNEYALASSCSFYAAHHICTGEGGMVSSENVEIVKTARRFAWWGRDCYCIGSANLLARGSCGKRFDKWLDTVDEVVDHKYIFTNMGYNLKPLDLQGAVGLIQLKKFDEIHQRRRRNKESLASVLSSCQIIRSVEELPPAEASWFGVPIICKDREVKQRFRNHLELNRIQTRNYFAGNILLHPGYRELGNYMDYPMANKVLHEVFFIGCAPTINEEMLGYMKQRIKELMDLPIT